MKSRLPHRLLFPQQRRFRDRPAVKMKSEVSIVRLLSFFFGGILLANFVLMTSATFRAPVAQPPLQPGVVAKRGPAAAVVAEHAVAEVAATDGRSVPETGAHPAAEQTPGPVVAKIDKGCVEHAREKLMTGLTHYYLQRRLRPGATSEDAADTSSLTGLLAGPGDPATMTPDVSCKG
jgi:hypothetical protein